MGTGVESSTDGRNSLALALVLCRGLVLLLLGLLLLDRILVPGLSLGLLDVSDVVVKKKQFMSTNLSSGGGSK